jgi:hypothetical protein
MNIALVGATGSDLDIKILASCLKYLNDYYGDISVLKREYDTIDLNRGRDFLTENETYDIVVMFMIFRYRAEELLDYEQRNLDNSMRVSPLHSPENWRKRLLSTRAQIIYVTGYNDFSEISSDYLGKLPGYELEKVGYGDIVYRVV